MMTIIQFVDIRYKSYIYIYMKEDLVCLMYIIMSSDYHILSIEKDHCFSL